MLSPNHWSSYWNGKIPGAVCSAMCLNPDIDFCNLSKPQFVIPCSQDCRAPASKVTQICLVSGDGDSVPGNRVLAVVSREFG